MIPDDYAVWAKALDMVCFWKTYAEFESHLQLSTMYILERTEQTGQKKIERYRKVMVVTRKLEQKIC